MENVIALLKTIHLFDGIEETEIQSLLTCLSVVTLTFEKKQAVFLEGDKIHQFGIVLSGQVQVIKEDFFGNRHIVTVLERGELFAEAFACSDIEALPVSVLCATDCVIMFIDYHKLITTCKQACSFHNKLIINMLHIMANKNILLNQKIQLTSNRTTQEKLLAYLSAEAKKAGSDHFHIPLNRQELADFLSVERSAMCAELSKLRDDHVLIYQKNNFTLLKK